MDENEKNRKWVGRIITILFAVSLATFLIFLGIQLYRSTIYDMFGEVYITENLKEALDNNSDIRTHSVGTEGLGDEGIIKITELVYIMELDENGKETGLGYLQFGVRYNKNHIDEVNRSINGENVKGISYDDISYDLVAYDYVTNADGKRVLSEVARYELSLGELDRGDKYQYRFYKFECQGVNLSCESLEIEMKLHGVEKVNENGQTLILENENAILVVDSDAIHTKDRKYIEYEFSKSEKKQLGK